MTVIEKRARELLAEAFACDVSELSVAEVRAARAVLAWFAALTPPESCALAAAARASLPFIAYAFAQGVDGAEEAGRAIEAALQTSVPEGYVLVPVEPTPEMLQAAAFGVSGKSGQKFKPMMSAGYAAMIAARPEVSP